MPYRRPPKMTLTNWDFGGAPSTWAYLQAGELFPATELVASLPSHRQPGQVYEYASVNTFVLSWLGGYRRHRLSAASERSA